ncbi:DUF2059 domain-containing protein [Phormidium sp. CLA17]|uniref:DUF2059 domain-containing protein n=1 Tax=Leptolyngbya sp. Cla-17 TaxID=2803751 RepID=UPI001490A293|nr:DUF2059 domain-containing protein [Leptolyngbya sp. Cla-17]MBM0743219.1 DUF2059 domain-containing protein [Leptolyngbya sp. Cla-17]
MCKLQTWRSKWLPIVCIIFVACTANSQPDPSQRGRSEIGTTAQPKQELAQAVLSEIGIAQHYDRYLGNSVDIVVAPATNRPKFHAWLQGVLAREAGWSHAKSSYLARLEATFSEAELKELLTLSKQPLMKKLMQTEVQAYVDASPERRKRLQKVWDDYNSGRIQIPPEVAKEAEQPRK